MVMLKQRMLRLKGGMEMPHELDHEQTLDLATDEEIKAHNKKHFEGWR